MDTYERVCCVYGYYVYQHIWSTAVGEFFHVKESQQAFKTGICCSRQKGWYGCRTFTSEGVVCLLTVPEAVPSTVKLVKDEDILLTYHKEGWRFLANCFFQVDLTV